MENIFTDMDCEQVRDVTVISRNGSKEQRISLNREGVFRFSESDGGPIKVMRLPSIKIWVFCTMISDMLETEGVSGDDGECWEVSARDNYGRRFRVTGAAISFLKRPKYDPSLYLRKETGMDELWLLDGNKAV